MASFRKIAREIGLKDVGEAKIGSPVCEKCDTPLRLGEEILCKEQKAKVTKKTFAYCPNCRKRAFLALEDRFPPGIKVGPHDD